ncbi:mandelate racemase/muconate lactonizing enzyme family protein [uncultured Dysosmobacter sp.]|uniref:mandelate racemase/muconate lactonizing enzyme family protein n=1 Tax=uncultured Dysosmobacter sp. TaxID=2591384 RepID=UPI00261D8E94|nr:mandelate racemase/muconate lactonizing enzyme family protein [uncultured Dysosmobacter sp.]
MRITSVDAILIPPEEFKFGNSRPVLCRINTDAGYYGYGEAGATFFMGSDAVFALIQEMAPLIIGMDPMYNEVIWEKIYNNGYWTKGNGAIIYSALSAIDIALWDIRGKATGLPVYALLGGKFRDKLRCYASQLQFGFDKTDPKFSAEEYREVAEEAVRRGYDAVKVDPMVFGRERGGEQLTSKQEFAFFDHKTLNTIAERIEATRQGVGKDADIIVEMHCTTRLPNAIQVAKAVEPYDIMYLEEPIAPLCPDATKQLAESTTIPLTNGERTYLRSGFLPFLQDRSLSMLQPDLGLCGGLTEGKKIADMAYTYDVGIQAHVCGTPISVAAGVQLEAAIANFTIHETHVSCLHDDFREMGTYDDFVPINGYITVPDRPGIGQELSDAALRRAVIATIK